MGQLYSGNLEAYKWARNRLNSLGIAVMASYENYDPVFMAYTESITLYGPDNDVSNPLIAQEFWHHDIDVLYTNMAEWLNRQAVAYESWK